MLKPSIQVENPMVLYTYWPLTSPCNELHILMSSRSGMRSIIIFIYGSFYGIYRRSAVTRVCSIHPKFICLFTFFAIEKSNHFQEIRSPEALTALRLLSFHIYLLESQYYANFHYDFYCAKVIAHGLV